MSHRLAEGDVRILDPSKLKKFADDNFKFDENGRKLSKRVKNTVGKGEIAHYEQLILFPQCFQKACCCGNGLTFYQTICRRQNKCDPESEICYGMIRKHCGKRRKCWFTSIFSFSQNVFISLLPLGGNW